MKLQKIFLMLITLEILEIPSVTCAKPRRAHTDLPSSSLVKLDQPLVPAPGLTTFVLPNGLTCSLYPFGDTKRISLRLLVNAGCLMEKDDEDGLAHFIEHMTFNGTKHFAPGTLIHYFQSNGMGFGNDTNAFTTSLHTCYQIDLPDNTSKSLVKGLEVLWDQGFGCLFLPQEIERERGVILSELRTRDSAYVQAWQAMMRFMFPQSIVSKRFCIGTEQSIRSFQSKDFFNFYHQWYTPQRMTVLVTGDFNLEEIKKQLTAVFSTAQKKSTKNPDLGKVMADKNGFKADCFKHPELPEAAITLSTVRMVKQPLIKNLQYAQEDFAWQLITIMLEQYLQELQNTTPLTHFAFGRDIDVETFESCVLQLFSKKEDWSAIIPLAEKFIRQFSTFGFSQSMLEKAKKILEGRLEQVCTQQKNAKPKEMAETIIGALVKQSIFLSSEQTLDYFKQLTPTITPAFCLKLWEQLWNSGKLLFVSGPLDKDVSVDQIKSLYLQSKKDVLSLPKDLQEHVYLLPFPQPHEVKIVDRTFNEGLQLESLCLDNNVRINLKQTDYEKDRILVYVGLGKGLMALKDGSYPGIQYLLNTAFVIGGLKQCDRNVLNRIFDGKMINVDFDVDEDCYALKCVTNRKDFLQQMQLLCSYMIEPGYRQEALSLFQKNLQGAYEFFTKTPEGMLMFKGAMFLTRGDGRFGYPEKNVLMQRNLDEARKLLAPVFNKEYMEITIVGDFDRAKLIEQLLATVGQLEKRDEQKTVDPELRKVSWPEPQTKRFTYTSTLDRAILNVTWPTETADNVKHMHALMLLKNILANRLLQEIRQAWGDTYSPKVTSYQSVCFDRGYLSATLVLAPKRLDFITNKTVEIADKIAKQGITQKEFDCALKPLLTDVGQQIKTNKFWLEWLKNFQQYPQKAAWELNHLETFKNISIQDVEEVAKLYLNANSAICIQIKPE